MRLSSPNILFLFADDQRADTIGAHGNPHIRTPHIDSLVTSGFSFRRNYVFGGNSGAVCVPSRAMLMSGKTWFHIDTATLNGEKADAELFGENGYATFGTGKWHNGQPSWLRAFQRGESIMFGGMSDHTKVPIRDLQPDGTLSEQRFAEKFSSEMFADAAIDFLQSPRPPEAVLRLRRVHLAARSRGSRRKSIANTITRTARHCRRTSSRSSPSTTAP
jgi:arylsulfatase A-like enzyme